MICTAISETKLQAETGGRCINNETIIQSHYIEICAQWLFVTMVFLQQ